MTAENAVRTTGLLADVTGGGSYPICQLLMTEGTSVTFGQVAFTIGAPFGHSQPLAPAGLVRTLGGLTDRPVIDPVVPGAENDVMKSFWDQLTETGVDSGRGRIVRQGERHWLSVR